MPFGSIAWRSVRDASRPASHATTMRFGEAALIDLTLAEHPDLEQADARATLHDLKHITDQLLVRNPSYRCNRCGFGARSHHWQCPSCKEWGTVKPLLNYAVV